MKRIRPTLVALHREEPSLHRSIVRLLSPLFLLVACGNPMPPIDAAQGAAEAALSRKGRVINVPADQPTIAAAMAAAQAGDTVKLAPGTYEETLVLKTGVRVVGGPSMIDATGLDHGIVGDASVTCCASVEQLTVENSSFAGIVLNGSVGVRIADCEVSASGGRGINLSDADTVVAGSRVFNSAAAGIVVSGGHAMLTGNNIHDNSGAGNIRVTFGARASITGNTLSAGSNGIQIDSGDDPADLHPSSVQIEGNTVSENACAGVFIVDGSTAKLEKNTIRKNQCDGVTAAHGSVVTLERNEISENGAAGVTVTAGVDLADQVRSSARLEKNVVVANVGEGLQVVNADVSSEGDRFERNARGITGALGASIAVEGSAVSQSLIQGILTGDAFEFFCATPDCPQRQLGVATVQLTLDRVRVESSGGDGVVISSGGRVSITASIVTGNGTSGTGSGIALLSGRDYELGDGVFHHIDIPGSLTLRNSIVSSNASGGAYVVGTSTLDLGTDDGGRNSIVGNPGFAVANWTDPVSTVRAEGDWWGTADPGAIAAMMIGPVDFVPFLNSPPR